MKIINLFLISISFVFVCSSVRMYKNNEQNEFVKINDSTFVCSYEITNKEFSIFLKERGYSKSIIDTSNWYKLDKSGFYDFYGTFYHNSFEFENYPVVNISHKLAIEYCRWKTEKYNQEHSYKNREYIFFLPSIIEWQSVFNNYKSCSFNSRFYWGQSVYNEKGKLLVNLLIPDEYIVRYKKHPLFPVNSFLPFKENIHCLIGNVAEMTAVDGIAIGGSWLHTPLQSSLDSIQIYNNTECWVGFRPFVRLSKVTPKTNK